MHRSILMQSVRSLREEGAASVYFSLEEAAAVREEYACENSASSVDPRWTEEDDDEEDARSSSITFEDYFFDDSGKMELVKIPGKQMQILLGEQLADDGVRLKCEPYSTKVSKLVDNVFGQLLSCNLRHIQTFMVQDVYPCGLLKCYSSPFL